MNYRFNWHMYPNELFRPARIESRQSKINFIKHNYSEEMAEKWIKIIKPVKGKFPLEVEKAYTNYLRTQRKRKQALDDCGCFGILGEYHTPAIDVYNKARYNDERAAEIFEEMCVKYEKEIEKLHKKECPNCTWNGENIFNGYFSLER